MAAGSRGCRPQSHVTVACTLLLLAWSGATEDDVLGCPGTRQVDLDFTSVSSSNLAGKGPELSMPPNVRYLYTCSIHATAVDAVLEAGDTLESADPKRNGKEGRFARINLKAGSKANFTLSFRKSGTSQRLALQKLFLSIFDMETHGSLRNAPQGSAKVSVWGYKARAFPTAQADPRMLTEVTERNGVLTTGLAPEKNLAITFVFEEQAVIHFGLEAAADATGGQDFYFMGSTCDASPTVVSTSTTFEPPQPSPPRPTVQEVNVAGPARDVFDCQAGLWNCVKGWSKMKKDWCYERKKVDCEAEQGAALARLTALAKDGKTTTTAAPTTSSTTTSTTDAMGADWEACTARPVSSCQGKEVEWGDCEAQPSCSSLCEPQDCLFSEWGDWYPLGGCTGLCGRGRRIKQTNNACGKPCEGPKVETQNLPYCLSPTCVQVSRDCTWADWSDWTKCSHPTEQQTRAREVSVQALGNGSACEGGQNETRACAGPRAMACVLSDWGSWTECSATCGGGWKAQMRRVVRHAENGGRPCEGSVRQDMMCNTAPCGQRVDCRLGDWSEWTGCGGKAARQRYRERSVLEPAQAGGKPCGEHLEETAGCELPKVAECKLSDWSSWSPCPVSCGGGQIERNRHLSDDTCKLNTDGKELSLKEVSACATDACPSTAEADCDFSLWSEWQECSSTCGPGTTTRKRDLKAAAPGGRPCAGTLQDMRNCTASVAECPQQDCEWGDWLGWSTCSKTCGGGSKHRSRSVKTAPKGGGKLCSPEEKAQMEPCSTQNCTECINGSWSTWSSWSGCSSSCGAGYQSRSREIAQHANSCGEPAAGPMEEHRECQDQPTCGDISDCTLSAWGQWSACSSRCFGVRERDRRILALAMNGGKPCVDERMKEIAPCNPEPGHEPPYGCEEREQPEACQLGAWGEWSECSKSCGGGQHTRARHVLSPSSHSGDPCTAVLFEVSHCGKPLCGEPCEDCRWGPWSEWGECRHCSDMTYRRREIEKMPNHCGKPCDAGAAKEFADCSQKCVGGDDSFFCAWGQWSGESPCSAGCGPATKTRSRRLIVTEVPPDDANSILFKGPKDGSCSAAQINVSVCSNPSCNTPCTPTDCSFGTWGEWEDPTCERQLCERRRRIEVQDACGGAGCTGALVDSKPCPLDCNKPADCSLSEWSKWTGTCTRTEDQMTRGRSVLQRGENGGKPCSGNLIETRPCQEQAGPACEPVDCEAGAWSPWSDCSVSCGGDGGLRLRRRMIAKEASCGGAPCTATLAVLESCGSQPCENSTSDCQMSEWTPWTECDNRFERMRHRQVIKESSVNGKQCSMVTKEVQPCKQVVDCKVSDWIEWDVCDKSCGGGQQQRQRMVTRPPVGHGKPCPLGLVETQGCNRITCKDQDCEVGDWGAWTACSSSCGAGQRSRARSLIQLAQDDGVGCSLALSETEGCEEQRCSQAAALDCKWAEWSLWTDCTAKCGGGHRIRKRHIAQYPENGGEMCDSRPLEEIEPCNTDLCPEKECIDGSWGSWGEWEVCSMTCEGGITWRQRQVEVEANSCGLPAKGPSRETASCGAHTPCKVDRDCAFGEWEQWTACTRTCNGIQRRSRAVHAGSGSGQGCEGTVKEDRPCHDREGCPESKDSSNSCNLGDWDEWDACPVTCGGGQTERRRKFIEDLVGQGSHCTADLAETRSCGRVSCEEGCELVDCLWSDWGAWSACDKCEGQRTRLRHVERQPKCGGLQCEPGASEETANCTRMCHGNLQYCSWEDWSSWTKCSSSCGPGLRKRERHMAASETPPPQCPSEARIRVLVNGSAQELSTGMLLEQKFEELHRRATGLENRRSRDLMLSYALGSLGLLVASAAFRHRKMRQLLPEESILA